MKKTAPYWPVKDSQIKVLLDQLVTAIDYEMGHERNVDRNCRLQNIKEHLRRAWHEADGSPCEFNDLIPQ